MGIGVWKIELREPENYGTFALRRAKKVQCRDGNGIIYSFTLCKKYGTFALRRAKKVYKGWIWHLS